MPKRKSIDKCKSGDDFRKYVENHPNCKETRQNGSHFIAKGKAPGIVVIPVHSQDLPTGTRRSIIKMLKGIGLAGLFFGYLYIQSLLG